MSVATQALSAIRRISIVVAIAITFLFGLATTVYLSLRSPEVTIPDVVGKDRFEAERALSDAGLNFRVRATRPSNQLKADTVLFQLPRAGEVVKSGQTVAMDISRVAKEGEASEGIVADKKEDEEKGLDNRNANEAVANANENKPKRNKNRNANENVNANVNANSNANANSIGPDGNANTRTAKPNVNAAANTNRTGESGNVNLNENRRPPKPKPSPPGEDNP